MQLRAASAAPPRSIKAAAAPGTRKPVKQVKANYDPFTDSGKREITTRLQAATSPHWMDAGVWHKPILSRRQYAVIRKKHPELELPKRMVPPRSAGAPPIVKRAPKPPKLHKYDREEHREKRKADVVKAMKDMKKMIDNQRKAGRDERKKRREESPALMMNLPLRAANKKYRLIKLQERREKRAQEKAGAAKPAAKAAPAAAAALAAAATPAQSKKGDAKKTEAKKDGVGSMKV